MKHLMQIMALCLAFCLTGCAAVYVESPVGDKPVMLDAAEWDGFWIGGGETVASIKVIDPQEGMLRMSVIEYESGGKTRLDSDIVYIREWKHFLFASVPIQREGQSPLFYWARLDRDDDRVTFWIPNHHKIKALVQVGKLPGRIEQDKDKDVVLGNLDDAHYRILTSEAEGVLYQWDNPGVLIRIQSGR